MKNTTVTADCPVKADLVLINGNIWTVDEANPQAEAIAIWKHTILAVGTTEAIQPLIGPETEILDLQANLVLPGFSDTHTHFVYGGFHLLGVDLKDAKTEQEFGELLAAKSAELPEGAWITGGDWDHDKWPSGNLPTRNLIDRYVPDRPVLVSRYDAHICVANSLALQMAGITANTPNPDGGVILREPVTGEPTGALQDLAIELVSKIIPPKTRAEVRSAIEKGLAHAREHGITTIHQVDMEPLHLDIYQDLLDEGKLSARMVCFIPLTSYTHLADFGIKRNFSDKYWITLGGVKAFMDGSLGSSTALFYEPYSQDASTSGIYLTDPQDMMARMLEADEAGLQLAIHAIGDRANAELLDMYEEMITRNGSRDRRLRIEHCQHMRAEDFARYAHLGVIASVQPYHAIDDARFAEKRIGLERCATTYAFNSFLANGVTLAFGSDWTVGPLDAIMGIYAATARLPLDGSYPDGWFPEQRVPVDEAIKAYTLNSAYAGFQDDVLGSITPGKLADLVVLDRDIRIISPAQIKHAEVLFTIVDGKIVYRKAE